MSKMSNTWRQDKKKSDGLRARIRHPSPPDSFARRKGTLLTAQDLHTNSSFHLFLKSARLSGTPTRLSSWSLITYDRTFDHTSAGRGMTGLGWGNKGSKIKLPGERASGLGCRKIAGVSVYVLAMLMICVSELNSAGYADPWSGVSSKKDKGRSGHVGLSKMSCSRLVPPIWTGDWGFVAGNEAPGPSRRVCS